MVRVASDRGHSPQHTKAASFIRSRDFSRSACCAADRHGRLHDHDSGHIEQTGRHAQPQLTGTRHHNGPIEIDSELCRRLQPEIRDSYEGDPLSSLRWTCDESCRQARTVYRVRLTRPELNDSRQAW